jgi:hypothetical protein
MEGVGKAESERGSKEGPVTMFLEARRGGKRILSRHGPWLLIIEGSGWEERREKIWIQFGGRGKGSEEKGMRNDEGHWLTVVLSV